MTRRQWFGTVMPIAGIVYVIVLIAAPDNGQAAVIGALLLAVLVLVGIAVTRPGTDGRDRNRSRNRDRSR